MSIEANIPIITVSKNKKEIMYSLTLFLILFQLAKIQSGVKNVLNKIIKSEIPSTPTW